VCHVLLMCARVYGVSHTPRPTARTPRVIVGADRIKMGKETVCSVVVPLGYKRQQLRTLQVALGGLVVSVLTIGPKVHGFKTD
jgi:hypothetical protein